MFESSNGADEMPIMPHLSDAELASTAKKTLRFVVIMAALGGVLFGYDTGIISAGLLSISADFGLSAFGKELVTSAILIGGIFGALASGPVCDHFGRKRTVISPSRCFSLRARLRPALPRTQPG